MNEQNQIKILLVEDDDDLRESLVDCLELQGYVVCAVPKALNFYQRLSAHTFDVAIIDIGLPDQSGLDIVIHLKKNNQMGIVVLTAMGSPEIRLKGYQYGADLYLLKPIGCKELAAAILNLSTRLKKVERKVAEKPLDPELSWVLNVSEAKLMTYSGKGVGLSHRETKFLEILISHLGSKIGRSDISHRLNMDTSKKNDRRMDTMTRRLRQKVKNKTGIDLPIRTIYGEGYTFTGHAKIM